MSVGKCKEERGRRESKGRPTRLMLSAPCLLYLSGFPLKGAEVDLPDPPATAAGKYTVVSHRNLPTEQNCSELPQTELYTLCPVQVFWEK